MKVSMGPPPSRNPQLTNSDANPSVDTQNELSNPEKFKVPMGPPPPRNLQISDSDSNASVDNQNEVANSQEFKVRMGPPPIRNPQGFSSDTCAYEDPQNELSNSEKFKVPMGPPPARNPQLSNPDSNLSIDTHFEPSHSEKVKVPIGSPPPRSTNLPKTDANSPPAETQIDAQLPLGDDKSTHIVEPIEKALDETETESKHGSTTASEPSLSIEVPYTIPPWSEPPMYPFFLEVLKDGSIIDQFNVHEKGAYMFGRVDLCDFVLEHPTISRFHAVLQFKKNGDAYLYDLGSTHGTSVNKSQVKKKVYTELHVGDVIRFGQSSRLYIFQGPSELMPQEGDLRNIRKAKIQEEMQDREASLLRAKQEASIADGISWGISEDAIEEIEEDADEVTWQTYKGQLTEKQEKTREKIIKRMEKIANMKKEIGAIRTKDISQGGLTQGQQTQIARNEQRISQIMEELENLEETLNESIQESLGARVGKIHHGKKRAAAEDEEEVLSDDDDEFYDRTKKKPTLQKTSEQQSIETADTLLDKKAAIIKEMDDKKKLLQNEKSRDIPKTEDGTEVGDPLDAYMSGLSSQLVLDASVQLEKELSSLQSELDRILYLLRIADPTGEAMKRRESRAQESKSKRPEISISTVKKRLPMEQKKASISEKPKNGFKNEETPSSVAEATKDPEAEIIAAEATETQKTIYTVTKPQWLGAIEDTEVKEVEKREASIDTHDSDQFVDYKDRKKVLGDMDGAPVQMKSEIEVAAPGLIIRKRKQTEKPGGSNNEDAEQSTSSAGSETTAAEAVALLLKHKRGYYTSDSEGKYESEDIQGGTQSKKENKPRRVLGPQRPPFLDSNPDYESWVPPEGQSGDGRTSLNERYGY